MSLSLAVAGLYNELLVRNNEYHSRFPLQNPDLHPSSWNDDYDNEYMQHFVYPLSASECLSYYNYLTSHHSDDLEEYICSEVYKDSNFFNDLIGTKYISEGKFAEAIPYLEKVDLSYLSKLNTSDYMYNRDFTKARWFVLQRSKNDLEGISKKSFTQNPKIIYCRSMLDLENKFAKMKQSDAKYAIAYQLACQYYQASYKGECWWLTSYYNSSSYERVLYSYNMDFIEKSKEYLTYCLSSTDPDMKSKCLYALAYIPTDIWAESVTDYDDNGRLITTYMNPNPESSQYQYLSMLNTYYNSHKDEVPSYISKCDVLKQFRKLEWYSE